MSYCNNINSNEELNESSNSERSDFAQDDFRMFVESVYREPDIVEVRMIKGDQVKQIWKTPVELLASYDKLKAQNNVGYGIFYGTYPRIRVGGSKSADVDQGRCVWADFDHTTVDEAKKRIAEAGLPRPSILVNSGNGAHAWWLFDETHDAKELIKLVNDFAAMLGSDRNVAKLPQIMRAPGFNNVKDLLNPKPCYIVETNGRCNFYELRTLVPEAANQKKHRVLAKEVLEEIAYGQRNSTLLSVAGTLRRRGLSPEEIVVLLHKVNTGRCKPPLDDDEVIAIANSIGGYVPSVGILEIDYALFTFDDIGNGRRLASFHKDGILYCAELKSWLCWNGMVWIVELCEIERRAKHVVDVMREEPKRKDLDEELKELLKRHIKASSRASSVRAMIEMAKSESSIAAKPDQFDTDPWLLNCMNGTIDLRTGELRKHCREDYITKMVPFDYEEVPCPRWEQFLLEIMDNNPLMVDFLQRMVGYMITGLSDLRLLFILYGSGANGKTTFTEMLRVMLGNYAVKTPMSTFTKTNNHDGPSPFIVRLAGIRFVAVSEIDRSYVLDEGKIKELTGNEAIACRDMYEKPIELLPTFKFAISTNHLPEIRGSDDGIYDRLKIVPFTARIPEDKRDPELMNKLREEMPGILYWAVQGCLKYQAEGLDMPEEVLKASNQFREDMDPISRFLDERCEKVRGEMIEKGILYDTYEQWSNENNIDLISKTAFGKRMKQAGFEGERSGSTRYWECLKLK